MHQQNFMIFGIYKIHNAEYEMMLSLCHYVNSCARGRYKHEYFLSAL